MRHIVHGLLGTAVVIAIALSLGGCPSLEGGSDVTTLGCPWGSGACPSEAQAVYLNFASYDCAYFQPFTWSSGDGLERVFSVGDLSLGYSISDVEAAARIQSRMESLFAGLNVQFYNSYDGVPPLPQGRYSTIYFGAEWLPSGNCGASPHPIDYDNQKVSDEAVAYTTGDYYGDKLIDIANAAAHELGHLLGLEHTAGDNDIMNTNGRANRDPAAYRFMKAPFASDVKEYTGLVQDAPAILKCVLGLASDDGERDLSITSFSINNGAASTTSTSVTLNNSCTGSPTFYKASESPSFSGVSWKSYSETPSFTLSSGAGTKTVYFKVMNYTDESSVVSDTITLQGPANVTSLFEDFSAGNYDMWQDFQNLAYAGDISTTVIDGYLQITRANAPGAGGTVGIRRDVSIPVDSATQISFDICPVYSSVRTETGDNNAEYPANVQLKLDTPDGQVTLRLAYNNDGYKPNRNESGFVQISKANVSGWQRDQVYRVRDYVPAATRITKVELFGNGWDFTGCWDNIRISSGG